MYVETASSPTVFEHIPAPMSPSGTFRDYLSRLGGAAESLAVSTEIDWNYRRTKVESGNVGAAESLAVSTETATLQDKLTALYLNLYFASPTAVMTNQRLISQLFPQVVAVREDSQDAMVTLDKQRMQLQDALLVAFEIDPLEDGMDHPAERILADALQSGEEYHVLAWVREFALDAAHPNFAASVLRCLGHQMVGTGAWRTRLVRNALALDEVEIRDAAVQAAALWGDREIRWVLAAHDEPISWLGTYIQDVIEDLGA